MKPLFRFGPGQDGIRVEDMWVNPRSRDDIPKLLGCLRELYLDVDLREEVFRLLEDRLGSSGAGAFAVERSCAWAVEAASRFRLRPLHEHANTHVVLRQLLGHGEHDRIPYSRNRNLRDVSLLDEDTLRAIRNLAGQSGMRLFRG